MIDLQNVNKLLFHNKLASETATTLYPLVVWYGEDGETVVGSYESLPGEKDYEISVPDNARYAIFNSLKTFAIQTTRLICHAKYKCQSDAPKMVYISSIKGNDENDGLTAEYPIQTIDRANRILAPNGTLVMMEGDYFRPDIDLGNYGTIIGQGMVRIINGYKINNAVLLDSSRHLYCADTPFSIPTSSYLWLHDLPDAKTKIQEIEKHPLHGNRTYRIPSTRIYHSEESFENWHETDSILHWTVASGKIYFTIPENTDLSSTPVIIPRYDIFSSAENTVTIKNVNILYSSLLLNRLTGELNQVNVGMCNATGAFNFAGCKNMNVITCEAFASSNDGFNTHATEEINSEIHFYNCYGHDNSDDGESCHAYSKSFHEGGLFGNYPKGIQSVYSQCFTAGY